MSEADWINIAYEQLYRMMHIAHTRECNICQLRNSFSINVNYLIKNVFTEGVAMSLMKKPDSMCSNMYLGTCMCLFVRATIEYNLHIAVFICEVIVFYCRYTKTSPNLRYWLCSYTCTQDPNLT